jgi:hypothetical protein
MSDSEKPESVMDRAKARFSAFKLKYPLVLAAVVGYACFEESGAMPKSFHPSNYLRFCFSSSE